MIWVPPSTCLASPVSQIIDAPLCSPSPAKGFGVAATTSTGFENKLIQSKSSQIKGNQSNQSKKHKPDPMTTTPLPNRTSPADPQNKTRNHLQVQNKPKPRTKNQQLRTSLGRSAVAHGNPR